MDITKRNVSADLGSGGFAVDRMTESRETLISEIRLLDGGWDRRVLGGRMTIVLEGRYSIARDGQFFAELTEGLEGALIAGAEIDGDEYTDLCCSKAVLTESADSGIGKFIITLKKPE